MPERCAALPASLRHVFADVDLILHAGDVGELWVLDELSRMAPVTAVHGNDETADAQRALPYQQLIAVGEQRILLWHSHYPNPIDEMHSRIGDDMVHKLNRCVARGRSAAAQIVVFGHWHIPLVFESDGVLVINPGALASGGWFKRLTVPTVALLFLLKNGRIHLTHVNLAEPERPYLPPTNLAAGFRANARRYEASILAADLQNANAQPHPIFAQLTSSEITSIWLPLAHRCWSGQQAVVDRPTLREAIEQAFLPPARRQALLLLLSASATAV